MNTSNSLNSSMTSFCQSSRLLGMSSHDEHNLESYIRKLVKNNGNEFVIDRLKVLKLHTIRKIEDPGYRLPKLFDNGTGSISWNRKLDSPKGPLSVIYKTWTKPSSRLKGIGALINAFQEDHVTAKQFKKFREGVNTDGHYCDLSASLYISPLEAKIFCHTVSEKEKNLPLFSPSDLTGSLIPMGKSDFSTVELKKDLLSSDSNKRHNSLAKLSKISDLQWTLAPAITTDYIKHNFSSYKDIATATHQGYKMLSSDVNHELHLYPGKLPADCAGQLSLLQKPGGKLRSVFNTNRVVNYSLTPYGDGLEAAFYDLHPRHIAVKGQDKGFQIVQSMVRRGKTLVSADLTSATDRMNFRVFTNSLRKAILRNVFSEDQLMSLFSDYYTLERSSQICDLLEQQPIMVQGLHNAFPDPSHRYNKSEKDIHETIRGLRSVNLFEQTATLPFYSKDMSTSVALKTGQPLGMMGSFQTLTAMNFAIGRQAELNSNHQFSDEIPQFCCVGDDFVGDDHIMSEYSSIIRSVNGLDNSEKALHSDHAAEFLSHLITRDRVLAMKPKFQRGKYAVLLNAQKTSVTNVEHYYRLDKRTHEALDYLAQVGDPRQSGLTTPATSKRQPESVRNLVQALEKAVSLEDATKPSTLEVSKETVELAKSEQNVQHEPPLLSTDGGLHVIHRAVDDHENDHFSPIVERYDHHTAKRKKKQSLKQTYDSQIHRAELIRLAVKYINDNVDSAISIPYHKKKRNVSDYVIQSQYAVDDSDLTKRDPFPSVKSRKDQSNEIDRSKVYEEELSSSNIHPKPIDYSHDNENIVVNMLTIFDLMKSRKLKKGGYAFSFLRKLAQTSPDTYRIGRTYFDQDRRNALTDKTRNSVFELTLSKDPILDVNKHPSAYSELKTLGNSLAHSNTDLSFYPETGIRKDKDSRSSSSLTSTNDEGPDLI